MQAITFLPTIFGAGLSVVALFSFGSVQAGGNATNNALPPNAQPGECYARVRVAPKYRTTSKQVLVDEGWIEKRVLVKEAHSRIEKVPTVYGTKTERILLQKAACIWKNGLGPDAVPVSKHVLASARTQGVDLCGAPSGTCFHEHYRPPQYEIEEVQVGADTSNGVSGVTPVAKPVRYRYVDKKVLVKKASYEVREIPAVYGWVEEKVLDKPARTVWKKGTGPLQKIDEATGEIMCLVEEPATYKTIRKRVLKKPARTGRVKVPAQYKTIKVREPVAPGTAEPEEAPGDNKTMRVTRQVAKPMFIWHRSHAKGEPTSTRTGAQICLTKRPARYETITRKFVKAPATTRTVQVPAQYKTVKVRKPLAKPEYRTVTSKELLEDGGTEWRSILCKTNATPARISKVQRALQAAGYDPGRIDGVIGHGTMQAVNAFQRDKGLPVDKYLNLATLRVLGVSPK